MRHAATHAGRRTCARCGHEGPPADFRPPRRGARLLQKCWICRYLAAKTPRSRRNALPPSPFDPGTRASCPHSTQDRPPRTCRKCGAEKPLAEFYLDRGRGRRMTPCRVCIRAAMRRYYAENREKAREANRRWAAQEDPEQRRARVARYRQRHPREQAIRSRTNRLRVLGILELAAECADCRAPATDLHHETYGSVCALVSLCRRCHMARHFRHWRKHGGGPVKYPWEHDQPEDLPAKHAKKRERRRRTGFTTDGTDATDQEKRRAGVKPEDRKGQPRNTRKDAKEGEEWIRPRIARLRRRREPGVEPA